MCHCNNREFELAEEWVNGSGREFTYSIPDQVFFEGGWYEAKRRTPNSVTFGNEVSNGEIEYAITQFLQAKQKAGCPVRITPRLITNIRLLARYIEPEFENTTEASR